MDFLKKVISECYFLLEEKNSHSDTCQGLENPNLSLRKEFSDKILKNLVYKMCIGIFVEPYADKKILKSIDDVYDVGDLEDCAHILLEFTKY
jgi:hypothetical protein